MVESMSQARPPGKIELPKSLVKRAMTNEEPALLQMFQQFVPPEEEIKFVQFLGVQGIFGIGTRSFACLTERRVAAIRLGLFREVIYQDGFLEHLNSGFIHQPSLLGLYLILIFATFLGFTVGSMATLPLGVLGFLDSGFSSSFFLSCGLTLVLSALVTLLFWILGAKLFYGMVKCGAVWWIREGVSIYAFANRGKILRVISLYRATSHLREERIRRFENLDPGAQVSGNFQQ